MKKIAKLFAALCVFAAAVSCADRLSVNDEIQGETKLVPCTFEASMPETKATLNGYEVVWQAGDKIAVYDNKHAKTEFVLKSGAGTKTAVFEGSIAEGYTGFYVVYPASAAGVKGEITVPAKQNIAAGATADPAALIMKYGDKGTMKSPKVRAFSMSNACGIARMTVPAGTTSATFSGNGTFYTADLAAAPSAAATVDVVLPMAKYEDILVAVTTGAESFVKASVNPFNIHTGEIIKLGDVKGDPAVLIKNAAEFKSFLEGWPKLNAYVVGDLDLTGVEIPDTATVTGVFDGRGCAIKNAALKAPVFNVNNGTIRNVVIDKSCALNSATPLVATLVNTSNGTIENCTNNAEVKYEAASSDPVLIGGLVVVNRGLMKNCTNAGKITFTTKGEAKVSAPFVGGVAAFTTGQMTDVVNNAEVDIDIYGSSSATSTTSGIHPAQQIMSATVMPAGGGIAGTAFYGSDTVTKGFDNCVNNGKFSWTYNCGDVASYVFVRTYVAGVCGAVVAGHLNDCSNKGPVEAIFEAGAATKNAKQIWVGGIYNVNVNETGYKTGYPTASRCVNYGDITLKTDFNDANNYVAGICGASDIETSGAFNPVVFGCINNGKITAEGYGYDRVAGISAGAANLVKCINNGSVTGGANLKTSSNVCGICAYQNGAGVHGAEDCENYGDITCLGVNAVNVGGVFGAVGGTTAGSLYKGNIAVCKVTGSSVCSVGILAGLANNKAYTFGTEDKPNQAKGTVVKGDDTVTIDAANIGDYAFGNAKSSELTNVVSNLAAYVVPTSIEYAGETYKIVRLKDGKWWMAENLRYVPEGFTPSSDLKNVTAGVYYPVVNNAGTAAFSTDVAVIKAKGYLYQSEVALGLKVGDLKTAAQAEALEGCRGICPEGWHIPTIEDITNLVGKAVSPIETNVKAPYYNGSNGSIALLNADGFDIDAYGAVTISDNTKTSASLMGALKGFTDKTSSGYIAGSSYAGVTYAVSGDDRTAATNFSFFGFMPMTNKTAEADYTCNGAKVSYRVGTSVRCVKDNN